MGVIRGLVRVRVRVGIRLGNGERRNDRNPPPITPRGVLRFGVVVKPRGGYGLGVEGRGFQVGGGRLSGR